MSEVMEAEQLVGVDHPDFLRGRVQSALDEHDATMMSCPVQNPVRGKVVGANESCPVCSAKASGSCGVSSGAGYRLSRAIRSALEAVA